MIALPLQSSFLTTLLDVIKNAKKELVSKTPEAQTHSERMIMYYGCMLPPFRTSVTFFANNNRNQQDMIFRDSVKPKCLEY